MAEQSTALHEQPVHELMLSAEEPATDIENGVALLAISVSNT